MNSGEIGFILFIVLFIGFGKLKEIRSGELGEFLSGLFWMVKTSQNDIFDEEGKSLRAQNDGKEVTLHITTMMDFWKQTENIRESAKIYLEDTGKMGRNLDLTFTSSQDDEDDWLEIRYLTGKKFSEQRKPIWIRRGLSKPLPLSKKYSRRQRRKERSGGIKVSANRVKG